MRIDIMIMVCLLFISCNGANDHIKINMIKINSGDSLLGETLLEGDSLSNFYDLAISDDYCLLLSYGDTIMKMFTLKDIGKPLDCILKRIDSEELQHPFFVKYNYQTSGEKNLFTIFDNKLSCFNQILINEDSSIVLKEKIPYPVVYNPNPSPILSSMDLSITKDNIYGVPVERYKRALFYSFNKDSGYTWIKPYPPLIDGYQKCNISEIYITNLCVNESQKTIVSALRFINAVQFYSTEGELKNAITVGDSYSFPSKDSSGMFLDLLRSPKYFINIYCTSRYVYCLYDGSANYTNDSIIVVFRCDGKHVMTFNTDRSLRKIVVEKNDKFILALAANEKEGRDIVKYTLPEAF